MTQDEATLAALMRRDAAVLKARQAAEALDEEWLPRRRRKAGNAPRGTGPTTIASTRVTLSSGTRRAI